jgi:hypothetical protein
MKALGFTEIKKNWILEGNKDSTWRINSAKDLKVDDEIALIESATNEVFAHAIITNVIDKQIAGVTEEDMKGKYSSKEEMFTDLRRFYADINDSSMVKMITFKIV